MDEMGIAGLFSVYQFVGSALSLRKVDDQKMVRLEWGSALTRGWISKYRRNKRRRKEEKQEERRGELATRNWELCTEYCGTMVR